MFDIIEEYKDWSGLVRRPPTRSILAVAQLLTDQPDVQTTVVNPDAHIPVDRRAPFVTLRESSSGATFTSEITEGHFRSPKSAGYYHLRGSDGVWSSNQIMVTPKPTEGTSDTIWGVQLQLYGLSSRRGDQICDFGDLFLLVEQLANAGCQYLLVSPICDPGDPGNDYAPYSPQSRNRINPIFVDPTWLSAGSGALPLEADHSTGPLSGVVDFVKAWEQRRSMLRKAFDKSVPDHSPSFGAWLQMIARDQLKLCQARAREGGMKIGLILDFPAGTRVVSPNEVTIGCPPELMNKYGQDWQLAPIDPSTASSDFFMSFRRDLTALLDVSGGVRIDHFAGLFRQWWIPPGASAADGVYVKSPTGALAAAVSIETAKCGAAVIAENIGVFDASITRHAHSSGFRTMDVLLLHARSQTADSFADVAQIMCTPSTHDTPTTASVFTGEFLREEVEAGLLSPSDQRQELNNVRLRLNGLGIATHRGPSFGVFETYQYLNTTLATSICVPFQDFFLETARHNVPGVVRSEFWRRRYSWNGKRVAPAQVRDVFADRSGPQRQLVNILNAR